MKHRLKPTLTEDDLMLLCDFLDDGYSIIESIEMVAVYEREEAFLRLKSILLSGETVQNAFTYFDIDCKWLEYFSFMSKFANLTQAMKGAKQLTKMTETFMQILKKQLAYPFGLIVCMLFFSLFMVTSIQPQLNALLQSFEMEASPLENIFFLLISYLPLFLMILIAFVIVYFIHLYMVVTSRNFNQIKRKLQEPLSKTIMQYYYSLKFAYFYATLSSYVTGLYDGVTLMYEKMSTSDLMVVIYELKKGLEQGQQLEKIISVSPFFHPSLKKYTLVLLKQGKSMQLLENYVNQTMTYLEKKIKLYSRIMVTSIYVLTALYIVILYLLMMFPMFKIASQL